MCRSASGSPTATTRATTPRAAAASPPIRSGSAPCSGAPPARGPRRTASSQPAAGPQPTSEAERAAVAEALRLADLWLDEVTDLPSGIDRALAWSRVEGGEETLPAWSALIDPLAERVVAAMTSALPQDAASMVGPIAGIMGR